jgi:flagellar protein FlaG
MADASVSQMVFFIAAVLVAGSMAGVFISVSNSMSHTIEQRGDSMSTQLQTDITIINDPVVVPYSDGNLTLYVKNTGTSTLSENSLTILVDGEFYNATSITSSNSDQKWLPEKVLTIQLDVHLNTGDHSAKVVTESGINDVLQFRIN